MKEKILSHYLSSAFCLTLLSVAFPLSAEEQKGVEIHLSEVELQEIFANPMRSYVYVGPDATNMLDIMQELGKFDTNPNSLINGLADHISKGFAIGNYDAVAQALEEAEQVLAKNEEALGKDKAAALARSLNAIVEQVIEERLNLDAEALAFLKDQVATKSDATRSCCNPHVYGLRLLVIKEKLDVLGKVKFKNKVTFKDDVKFEEDVVFEDDVTFKDEVEFRDDVTIEGTLSVADTTIGCDITVGCNINMVESTDAAHGNILKDGNRFIHNFGLNNTFVGENSGNFTMTGVGNTGMGINTLASNTIGTFNVAVGTNALLSNTTGNDNIAIGNGTLFFNTTGVNNVAIGGAALQNNTIGSANIALGLTALLNNTTGNNNIGIGGNALLANATGVSNIAIGASALQNNLVDGNVAIGVTALQANTTGVSNTAVGTNALSANTTGTGNTAIGTSALSANTIGNSNTALGINTLSANTTGTFNVAIGSNALPSNTAGSDNVAIGNVCLFSNTTGTGNVAIGGAALQSNTIGINSTAVGFNALLSNTGDGNLALGAGAGSSLTTGTNNICIANAGVAAESDTTRLGGTQTRCFAAGIRGVVTGIADAIPVLIDSAGQLGTVSSSKRFKHDVQDINVDSANIYKLRPVSFIYNADESNTRQFGLIAEEVDKVFSAIVVKDEDGNPYTVQYHVLPVLLLNELKKLAARVAVLESRR